jgi:hypothetical protein
MIRIIELTRCGIECGNWEHVMIEGYNNKRRYCTEAKKEIPIPSERVDGFPVWCPLSDIKKIQAEAYNQALQDLIDNDLLPDKEKNLRRYKK